MTLALADAGVTRLASLSRAETRQARPAGRVRAEAGAEQPVAAIGFGALLAATHLFLGVTGAVTWPEWISGLAFGLIIAGAGNHLRIFGRPESRYRDDLLRLPRYVAVSWR